MKVKIFMNTAGHNHERDILRKMHDGITAKLVPTDKAKQREFRRVSKALGMQGAGVEYCYDEKYSKCDVAVMFGSWKPERSNIHHIVRSSIVESGTPFICLETPLLGRKVFKPNEHQRVGINGFLNRDAYFGPDIDYPGDRLSQLGISWNGWKKTRGKKIVIALQLAGDASLRHNDINQWCMQTVLELRSITERPIEIRTHPGISAKGWGNHEGLFRDLAFMGIKDIKFVNGREVPWENQILDAHCVVAYTSGLSIDAIVNGIPVIACDEGNFAWTIGERNLKNVERVKMASDNDVKCWLQNLAYCQWTPDEMASGQVWEHLKSTIDAIIKENREDD